MASPYQTIYAESPYRLRPYSAPTEKQRWYEMSSLEKQRELSSQQERLSGLPILPERKTFKERMKPLLNVLQIVGGVLNIPSAMISGAAKQLSDGIPGFNAQEYYKDVFGFKNQVSWADVIEILSDDDKENVWDKKWAQIAAGLTLDILLDLSTYFGPTALTKLGKMGKSAREIAEQGAKLAGKGTLRANRVYKNIVNRSFEKVWSIRSPFGKMWVPLQGKTGKAMTEAVSGYHEVAKGLKAAKRTLPFGDFLRYQQVATQQLKRTAKEILPLALKRTPAQAIGDVLRKAVPGYRWLEGAFIPSRQAKIGIIISKLKTLEGTRQDLAPLERSIQKMVRGKNGKQLRKVLEIMETAPYVDDEMFRYVTKMANSFTDFAVAYEKSDVPWQKLLGEYAKNNEEFTQVLSKGVRKLLSDYEGRKALKAMGAPITVGAKPTPKQLIREMGAIYDKTSAKQAMVAFEKAKIKPGYLTNLAKFDPKWDVEKIFTRLGDKLNINQKNSILRLMNTTRDTLDYWWDVERASNLPEGFVRDYLSRATGVTKKVGKPMELGGVPGFTFERFSDMPMTKRFDIAVEQLVKDGIARTKKHARKLLREGKVEEYGRMVDTVHEMLYMRGVAHTKAMHKMKFIDEVKTFGQRVPADVSPGQGMARVLDIPELADYVFALDDAKFINRALGTLANDKSINQFLGFIDKTQGWWKSLVTVVNPGFHFRNMYSNHFIGWVRHGIKYFNPKTHKDAMALTLANLYPDNPGAWKMFGVKMSRLDDVKHGGMTLREISKRSRDYGMIRSGVRMTDMPMLKGSDAINTGAKKWLKRMNIASSDSAVAKFGEMVGGIIESEARAASFLVEFDKLGDLQRAARITQEIFVDYANLTQFEKQIGRRVIPFWSWLKQNTVNQVKFVFSQPGRYAKIPRVAQALERGAKQKVPEQYKPPWFKQAWLWQLPVTLPNGMPLFFNPNFPFQDLNKLNPADFKRNLLASISPFIKVPAELMTGYEFFRERPIERYPGYKAPVPGILQNFVSAMPSKMKTKLKLEKNNRGQYVMAPKMAHAISSLVPFIRNTSRMMMQEPAATPADKYFQWVSYMWGVKIKPLDTLTQQYYHTLDEIKKRKEGMARYGIQ